MKIIVIGCGKVGATLTEQLVNEGHSVVVIDMQEERLKNVTDLYDAIGVLGNGVSHKILLEAGVEDADLLLAVTGEDEQNLLCCMVARQTSNCSCIARIRNPIYNGEADFLMREFGLSMIVNPERAAANEIARIFNYPFASRVDTFAKGNVDILHFELKENSPLCGIKLMDFHKTFNSKVLVCSVIRDDEACIPGGDFVLQAGDQVSIAAEKHSATEFFKKIGLLQSKVNSVLLAGGGKISYYLANALIERGMKVTIVERDRERCLFLAEELPNATIVCGNASDQNFLLQQGLIEMSGFAALTGMDEENIMLSLYADSISNAKTVTKINRIELDTFVKRLHLGSIVCPKLLTVDYITRFVRSTSQSGSSNVEKLYKLAGGKVEALEFIIKEGCKVADVPLMNLKLKKNTLICCIYRNGRAIIPSGQDSMQKGDLVIVMLAGYRISNIEEILEA